MNKKIKILMGVLVLLIFSVTTVFAINIGNTGYKLADTNSYETITFNKYNSGSSTISMSVYNNTGKTLFIPTKTNAEIKSLFDTSLNISAFKENSYISGGCANGKVSGVPGSAIEMVKQIYVPISGNYAFRMKIQRQDFENYEDFYMYVDLNHDGDYNDSGEYLGRSDDTGTDDNSLGKGKGISANTDGSGARVFRHLDAGNYNFKMKDVHNSSNTNVGIGYFRLYLY